MEHGCLLPYRGEAFYHGSLAEPVSCIIGGFHVNYHTRAGSYEHRMGIVKGGQMALLAGVGPMGLGAIDYALHCDRRPGLLVGTDFDDDRLQRAREIYSEAEAERCGVRLVYVNTRDVSDVPGHLLSIGDGHGYDDVYVYAPSVPWWNRRFRFWPMTGASISSPDRPIRNSQPVSIFTMSITGRLMLPEQRRQYG
jgi:threonine dehydrogenase-like Zn-dependent dehydrogenase